MLISSLEGRLVDADGNLIGMVRVSRKGSVSREGRLWSGEIDLTGSAPGVETLFNRFETLVNEQVLSLLDELQAEIARLDARLLVAERAPIPVADLQIYPTQRGVSFRISHP
jgi:hypothetical protein